MQYTKALALALVLAPFSLASPMTKRDEKQWDANGNVKLTFSKETISIGSIKIEDIKGKLAEACHESGQCETNDITMEGTWIIDFQDAAKEMTLGPSGSYPTWIRNGLLDVLVAAADSMKKCEDVEYDDPCPPGSPVCIPHDQSLNQCEVPQYWGINFQAPDASDSAPPFIGMDISQEKTESTACEDALSAIGAVAGAVNGVAGGYFTLLSFMCK